MTGGGFALVEGALTRGVLGQWQDVFGGSSDVWAAIVVIGVATYGFRLSFIHLFGRIDEVPQSVKRTLRYVPPAVLAALVFPDFVTLESSLIATLADERLIAGAVAGAVAWRTENVFATITVGMVALWLFRFVVFA
ncbi:AzlD domain-containing protein [Halorubrum sp. SD626R]|uniref:AzlD domain-containing protein n=1 Tax=Halorubrum sp. SD626R TaxID=1419722 RepID=UPI0010F62967|nr:AzlD domain-containing protein [Halorubrum sp. SD626R]TKX77580.1 AzlD domain-containing protein [Halorubrum sp. SD626R]